MISTETIAPSGWPFFRIVLPTRRRRWRVDAGDVALPRPEPRPPTIALIGTVQATGVLSFDFESGGAAPRRG